jgi:hypothetical protein
MTFALPIVHSTVNAASGRGKSTFPRLLEGAAAIGRASDGLTEMWVSSLPSGGRQRRNRSQRGRWAACLAAR